VAELLPRMPAEAPDDYVSFVDRHLPDLRTESARLAGDPACGDEIYPEALADVAARWQWLELLRTRLGRAGVADEYLRRTLETRAQRWRDDQVYPVEVVVTRADAGWPPAPFTGRPAAPPAGGRSPYAPPPAGSAGSAGTARPPRVSLGLRQAAFLGPTRQFPAAIAEAAIAWWHAYEVQRRRRRVLAATLAVLLFAALYNIATTHELA
jgi:hypothetical protein